MTHRVMGELLGQGEAVRASGEGPGGNYRFRYKGLQAIERYDRHGSMGHSFASFLR